MAIKLSKLLAEALKAVERFENDDRYLIDMDYWHRNADEDGPCHACLAGAWVAEALGIGPDVGFVPSSVLIDHKSTQSMYALEALRGGYIETACKFTDATMPLRCPEYVNVSEYKISPDAFKMDMNKLVGILEEHGI